MEYLRRKSGISCKGKPMLMEWIIKTEKKEKSPHRQGFMRNRLGCRENTNINISQNLHLETELEFRDSFPYS